jgi:hypothetical protein
MGWLTPKYPTSDTAGASALSKKPSRREQRQAAAIERGQRQRAGELRTIAAAVRNGGDTDLQAARKVIRRMMPDATDAEIRQAHAAARR